MTFYGALKAVHVLGAVLWVGGMFFAYAVLRPSLQVLDPAQRMSLHAQVFKRFFLVVWHAMPLLILTGFIMLFGYYGGMAHVDWNIHVHAAARTGDGSSVSGDRVRPYRTFTRTADRAAMAAAADSIRKLIGLNLGLGIITVVVAALS